MGVQHDTIDHTGITGVGGSLTVEDEGTPLATAASTLDFVGAGVTASGTGATKTITIPGSAALASASYRRTAGDYTTSSGTFVDVDGTNLALAITTGARRVLITVVGVAYNTNGAAQNINFDIDLDGARLGGTLGMTLVESGNSGQRLVNISYVTDALSAGSHTFKLQWSTTGATATLRGTSAGFPLRMAVVELA